MSLNKISLFCCALLFASLAHSKSNYSAERLAESLSLAKKHWADFKPQNYQFVFSWSCYCSPEFTSEKLITVTNNEITQIVDFATREPIPQDQFAEYSTIDSLFIKIEEALFIRKAYDMTISFNGDSGVPTKAYINYVDNIADDEIIFSIRYLIPN